MKNALSSILLCCIYSFGFSQIISELSTFSAPFAETDSIYLVVKVQVANSPATLESYDIIHSGTNINVKGCYSQGLLAISGERTDTFNLGIKPNGLYDIYLQLDQSACDGIADDLDSIQVSVGGAGLKLSKKSNILVYPNPFKEQIQITHNELEPISLRLFTMSGKEVFSSGNLNYQEIFILPHLENGMYYALINAEHEVFQKILIKQ